MAVASGAMAVGGTAYADSAADGAASGSPGVLSGNSIQVPVDVPVNVCGNTVNLVGLLNPAMGNSCANHGAPVASSAGSTTSGGATAAGVTHDSPGVLSGDGLQLPVHLPVNLSGNSVNAVGVGNPVFGNESVTGPQTGPQTGSHTGPQTGSHTGPQTGSHTGPVSEPRAHTRPATQVHRSTVVGQRTAPTLAHTGADMPWAPAAASLISLTAGAVLYRRFRPRVSDHWA